MIGAPAPHRRWFGLLGTALLLTTSPGLAQEASLEDALGGFDQLPEVAPQPAGTPPSSDPVTARPWRWGGDVSLSGVYNVAHDAPAAGEIDYRGLSRLRTKARLEFGMDIGDRWEGYISGYAFHDFAYELNDEPWPATLTDSLEQEAELTETWLRGEVGGQTDLTLGRQVVVWGKSDNIRITDVLNPLDFREPGLTDIEDLRLPVTMAKVDHYLDRWALSAMVIPEIRFNKTPPVGSDFYAFPSALPPEQLPDSGLDNAEYALAARGTFTGWDLSFYLADIYDDEPHRVVTPTGPQLQHARLQMVGSAANVAVGNWLLKAEAAVFDGLRVSTDTLERSRIDLLLGAEYSGITDTSIALEIANQHLTDFTPALRASGKLEDDTQVALRYQGDFMHSRLHLVAVGSRFTSSGGGFTRLQAQYDLRDGLNLIGGAVLFDGGDQLPFSAFGDNDRVFTELKYSF